MFSSDLNQHEHSFVLIVTAQRTVAQTTFSRARQKDTDSIFFFNLFEDGKGFMFWLLSFCYAKICVCLCVFELVFEELFRLFAESFLKIFSHNGNDSLESGQNSSCKII